MKKILLTLILPLYVNLSHGQNPLVRIWDQRFGGTSDDLLFRFHETSDKGFILGGMSKSPVSGDKTQANWDTTNSQYDYWIVKTDLLGNKQWDKRFGGITYDYLYSVEQTSDAGYILGGGSLSGVSGDKTQPSWGMDDYWIVKIDSVGNKLWDKRFGGSNSDGLFALQISPDKGYILGGMSSSDVGGDKSEPVWGNSIDFWIVKTDSSGNKQWDKRFGGTHNDHLKSLELTADGGYILGGWSFSGMNGDKTQPNWDTTSGTSDYWVVKIDSLGNKLWDKRFGGTLADELYSLRKTADGGYILGGTSASQISGDKTEANRDSTLYPTADYWVVKIDSLGNKQWDKRFGGTGAEFELGEIILTNDNGYLFSGRSMSQLSGDKYENNLGAVQTWIVKTDSWGNKQWDKTIFTTGNDYTSPNFGNAIQTEDGCYLTANSTIAGTGGYKTQSSQGANDYWIVKFCDSALINSTNPLESIHTKFEIFPNPFNSELTLRWKEVSGVKEITLFDITGKVILRRKTLEAEIKLSTEKMSAGFYMISYNNESFKLLKF
jgi:hypothetical protein